MKKLALAFLIVMLGSLSCLHEKRDISLGVVVEKNIRVYKKYNPVIHRYETKEAYYCILEEGDSIILTKREFLTLMKGDTLKRSVIVCQKKN